MIRNNSDFPLVFPVNLLLKERTVLVVGGGKIAQRKVRSLLEKGAKVKVVAIEAGSAILKWKEEKRIELELRPYDSKIDFYRKSRPVLIYAATDNHQVNGQILRDARENGVIACAIDGNWEDGDFITPSVLTTDSFTVAVSTNGRSCTSAKQTKEFLGRYISLAGRFKLLMIGTDHRLTDIQKREQLSLTNEKRVELGEMIRHIAGVHHFVLLSTCNRIEFYGLVAEGHPSLIRVLCRILNFDHLETSAFSIQEGEEAFAHLCRVLAGIYSQVTGEKHIVSQVTDAWQLSAKEGWGGDSIGKVLDEAKHVSRQIRAKIDPILYSKEIEDIAIQWANENGCLGKTENRGGTAHIPTIAIIGAGSIGRSLVERLGKVKCKILWVYHKNRPEPNEWTMAAGFVPWSELSVAISASELIFCATSAKDPILTSELAGCISLNRTVSILDLGMPRNVSAEFAPAVSKRAENGGIKNEPVRVIDLESLKHWYRDEQIDLAAVYRIADQVISEEKRGYPLS